MRHTLKPVVIAMVIVTVIAASLGALRLDQKQSSSMVMGPFVDATNEIAAGTASDATVLVAESARPKAPQFRLITVTGDTYSQESLRGQPALLMFWAPWCKVCQRELPILGEFYLKQKPTPLRVLAIGFADTRGHVEEFVKAHPSTFVFPTAYDAEDRVAQDFGVNATPTFILLDAQGYVRLVHRGGGISQNPQYQAFLATLR